MKNPNPIRQEQILDKTYVSVQDLYELYEIGIRACRSIHNEVKDELKSEGIPLLPTMPVLVPLKRVLKRFPLDDKAIRRAAERERALQNGTSDIQQ